MEAYEQCLQSNVCIDCLAKDVMCRAVCVEMLEPSLCVSFLHGILCMFLCQSVTTVTFDLPGYISLNCLDDFIQELLWEKKIKNSAGEVIEIFRLKVSDQLCILNNRKML